MFVGKGINRNSGLQSLGNTLPCLKPTEIFKNRHRIVGFVANKRLQNNSNDIVRLVVLGKVIK